jgi:hypothetical protein
MQEIYADGIGVHQTCKSVMESLLKYLIFNYSTPNAVQNVLPHGFAL